MNQVQKQTQEQKQIQEKRRTNLYLIFAGVAIIMFWRGLWGLMDLYLFPGNPALSYFISAIAGITIIYFNDRRLKELV